MTTYQSRNTPERSEGETLRARCLRIAGEYTSKDRNAAYGDPEDNFTNIADIWNAQGVRIDGREVNSTDVALMMIGMKLARLRHNPVHEDSWVDTAGYAACGMETAFKVVEPGNVTPIHALREHGWVSVNRCGEVVSVDELTDGTIGAVPHAAHGYKSGSQWCDGYV